MAATTLANNGLGNHAGTTAATSTVTTPAERLLKERVVSGWGDPQHTPQIEAQTYINVNGRTVWHWAAGAWS